MRLPGFIFVLLACLPAGSRVSAQTTIAGEVVDEQGADLAFVSVLVFEPGRNQVLFSDIEGHFSVKCKNLPDSILFRYVGYGEWRLDAAWLRAHAGAPLHIVLRETSNTLRELTILPGENPAERIMRQVVANRDRNNPERYPEYACMVYSKQSLKTNSNFRGALKLYEILKRDSLPTDTLASPARAQTRKGAPRNDDHDDLLIESVVRRSFRAPGDVKQEVLQNRISGFSELPVAALSDLIQPFTFYRDYIALIDKAFVNPVSPNSQKLYFFNIEDTLYRGPDTLYIISFRPHKGRVFDALKGSLCVNATDWALENVRAEPANRNSNLWLKIEQQYARVRDPGASAGYRWFPDQFNFEMSLGDPGGLMIQSTGHSRISEVDFHPDFSAADFDPEKQLIFRNNSQNDSLIEKWHEVMPLSRRDERTYQVLDSVGRRWHFEQLVWITNAGLSGALPLGNGLNLDASRLLGFSGYEKVRVGAGLTTAQSKPLQLPHAFDAEIWTGYGIGDRRWKYGGLLDWRTGKLRNQVLQLSVRHDLFPSGGMDGWLDFRGGFDQNFYSRTMNALDESQVSFRAKPFQGFSFYTALRHQALTPLFDYNYVPDINLSDGRRYTFFESILSARYAWGEISNEAASSDLQLLQHVPVLELTWEHGIKGVFGSRYRYERILGAVYQTCFIRRLGKLTWRLEVGRVFGEVPFQKLFVESQPGSGLAGAFTVSNTLQTLDTLVISDRFVNLYFSQRIGNIFYRTNWSAPRLTVLHNVAWGAISNPGNHLLGFKSLQQPVMEAGIRLDDLLRLNLLGLGYLGGGVAVFYGYGAGSSADWQQNIAVRLATRWSF